MTHLPLLMVQRFQFRSEIFTVVKREGVELFYVVDCDPIGEDCRVMVSVSVGNFYICGHKIITDEQVKLRPTSVKLMVLSRDCNTASRVLRGSFRRIARLMNKESEKKRRTKTERSVSMTRSITSSITTSLKINLTVMVFACLALAQTSARAVAITLTVDPNFPPGTTLDVLGDVNPPEPASAADDVKYINAIIPLALGGSTSVSVPGGKFDTVYRSENSFGTLPTATTVGDMSGGSTSITLTSAFEYLAGKYDGPNGGLEIWDIGSISAGSTIDIPSNAFGEGDDQYGLSGWVLFNAQTRQVPDGASSVLLLGMGFLGLGLLGRYFSPESKGAKA